MAELCSLINVRSAIVGNRLFFMSGNYTFDDGLGSRQEPYLYWINLNENFVVASYILQESLGKVESDYNSLPSSHLGDLASGTFFYNQEMLYSYGYTNQSIFPNKTIGGVKAYFLWAFNTTSNSAYFAQVIPDNGFNDVMRGQHVSIPQTGQSFYTGGKPIEGNISQTMVVFDAGNTYPLLPEFSYLFKKDPTHAPPDITDGSMSYIPLSKNGVLISFGGATADGSIGMLPMSQINIYDIASNAWYNLTASGTVPSARYSFCTGVSSSPDYSSFQITVYGGITEFDGRDVLLLGNLYVLTIPRFQWILVEGVNDPDASIENGTRRVGHKCDMWAGGQMVVTGGHIVPDSSPVIYNYWCNLTYRPFKILDTATYLWQNRLTGPEYAYTVPELVYNIIGGNSTGGAVLTSPLAGWPTPTLEAIFRLNRSVIANNVSTTISATSSVVSSSTPKTPNPSPTVASNPEPPTRIIAGSITGSLLFAVTILSCGLLYWRRRRGKRRTLSRSWEKPELAANSRTRPELPDGTPRSELSAAPIPNPELHGTSRSVELLVPSERRQELAGDPPVAYEVPG